MALREPQSPGAVADLVQAFVEAWQHESIDALIALLAPDAGPLEARGRGGRALVEAWRQRLRSHGYARLAGMDLVRPERVQRWEWDELGAPGAPERPPDMRPGEIYVRAPLEVTSIGGEKLFDGALVMLLREEGGKLRIAAYGETQER